MVISPKRILWPTDFSELSMNGGKYAKAFCDLFGGELHIIHVLSPPSALEMTTTLLENVPESDQAGKMVEMAKDGLRRLVDARFDRDPKIVCDSFFGTAWSGVCNYATENGIDLIIISTHGRTGIQHVMIGSTAERVVQHSPCPVLVVKNPEREFVTD